MELAGQLAAEYLHHDLVLTERLLTPPRRDYKDGVTVHRLIDEICDEQSPDGRILLVDNVEMLFSPDLGKINPVETFKRMSRQRPVILALPMRRQGDTIEYSTLDRADHMSIPLETYPVIDMSEAKMDALIRDLIQFEEVEEVIKLRKEERTQEYVEKYVISESLRRNLL
jgi:hypothetical protein